MVKEAFHHRGFGLDECFVADLARSWHVDAHLIEQLAVAVENQDGVRQKHRFAAVVRDEDDRFARLLPDVKQIAAEFLGGELNEAAERFGLKQDVRIDRECPCDADPLAHPARKLLWVAVNFVFKTDEFEIAVDSPRLILRGYLLGPEGEPNVLANRQPIEQPWLLEDVAVKERPRLDALAVVSDLAAVRLNESGDNVEQRRLPTARGTHNRGKAALGDLEVEIFEHGERLAAVLERFSKVRKLDNAGLGVELLGHSRD